MKMDRSTRLNIRSQNFVMGLILTILLALAAYASNRYQVRWDWTKSGRHTLAEQSVKAVKAFPDGLTFTVYIQERGDKRQQIQELMEKYQVVNPSITIRYVDPDLDPAAARQAEVAVYGTVILRAGEKSEKITESTEEAVTNGLIRLAKGSAKTLRVINGHGEHPITGSTDGGAGGKDRFAYTQATALLKGEGYLVSTLNLAETEKIPEDTAVILLAGPQKALLPVETQRLKTWYDAGGRMLIMLDPDKDVGLDSILEPHGISLLKGVTLDPAAQMFGGSPTTPLISRYASGHVITKNLAAATIFPDTGGLDLQTVTMGATPESKQTRTKILESADRGWLETSDLASGQAEFNPDKGDRKGPVLIGAAVESGKQRLLVLANSNFVADAYIGALGNADLFLNLVRWLAEDENFIAIKPKEVLDAGLTLPAGDALVLFWGLVLIIPVMLLGLGGSIWYKRRRR